MDPLDGFTVYCDLPDCPCNENVFGHGSTEISAYKIACEKYRKNRTNDS